LPFWSFLFLASVCLKKVLYPFAGRIIIKPVLECSYLIVNLSRFSFKGRIMNKVSLRALPAFLLIGILFFSSLPRQRVIASTLENNHTPGHQLLPFSDGDGFILYASEDGDASCREATNDDEKLLVRGDLGNDLHQITPPRLLAADGLTITLRATQQLESFPQAKAAFIRAAAAWEALIKNPLTILMDVDFGTSRFGTPFPSGVLGATSSQALKDATGYANVRSKLIAGATSDQERALYNALPSSNLPTDFGTSQSVTAPSALWRAIGELPAVANPATETDYGPLPAIGFNSAFTYDFDPSNGIDAGKMDFEAVCIHEIGHALGFTSIASTQSGAPNASIWDLFRFNPGVTMSTFSSAQRILSAGGQQVFFAGNSTLQLSTGVNSPGDGRQTSHWKDDQLTSQHVGIMDPTLPNSVRFVITQNDKDAIDTMGYELKPSSGGGGSGGGGGGGGGGTGGGLGTPPSTSQFSASLNGDVLSLTGLALDSDGDVKQAQVSLLDVANAVVSNGSPVDVNFGISTQSNFNLQFSNLGAFPTVTQVSLVFIDSKGNRSPAVTADFSKADTGGASLAKVTFDASEGILTLKGIGFDKFMQIEVNGQIVTPTKIKIKGGGVKANIIGSQTKLNLRNGANRVKVITVGHRSNIFVLSI
jgi:hypothetical protein